ncbi:hypothetical protein AMTRI_Chr05g61450 [Amborella trichopoda]
MKDFDSFESPELTPLFQGSWSQSVQKESCHPQMAGAKGSSCAIEGCDCKVMSEKRREDILPCECNIKICRNCYLDAVKTGGGICPGCKEPYKNGGDLEKVGLDSERPMHLVYEFV